MSLLDLFRAPAIMAGVTTVDQVQAAIGTGGGYVRDVSRLPFVSPFSPDTGLFQWIADDVLGEAASTLVTSRAAAMRLPGISRGRNLLVTTIARLPLVVLRGATVLPIQPSWTLATSDGSSPQLRTAMTVDDLIFHGCSLWHRTNGADSFPLNADRVPFHDWSISDDRRLLVNGSPVADEREWTLIPGLHEGILSFGVDVLSDAKSIAALVKDRLLNPVPDINLEAQPESEDMTNDEWIEFVTTYVKNRRLNKGVGFTNRFVKAVPMPGRKDADLLIEARNASVVDQARLIGVHAGLLDATAPKASLNYETATGRNQEFVDFDLWTYLLPITARLSMDDFVPHGQRTAFDLNDFTGPTPGPTGAPTED